jgi:hypothetical protein
MMNYSAKPADLADRDYSFRDFAAEVLRSIG